MPRFSSAPEKNSSCTMYDAFDWAGSMTYVCVPPTASPLPAPSSTVSAVCELVPSSAGAESSPRQATNATNRMNSIVTRFIIFAFPSLVTLIVDALLLQRTMIQADLTHFHGISVYLAAPHRHPLHASVHNLRCVSESVCIRITHHSALYVNSHMISPSSRPQSLYSRLRSLPSAPM